MTLRPCCGATPELFRQKDFTAAKFADSVNHFVGLGENAALQELRGLALEWSKDFADHDGEWSVNERIGWMCRVLFDPKGAEPIRQPFFGALDLPYFTIPLSTWPCYPVALSGSTYFVLSEGYSGVGVPEDPKDYIEHCRKNGVFRKIKVAVSTRAQALREVAALRISKGWTGIKWTDSGADWRKAQAWQFIQKQAESIPTA